MTAAGQNAKWRHYNSMSAFLPIATVKANLRQFPLGGVARRRQLPYVPQFKNLNTLRIIAKKTENQGSVSQFPRPITKRSAAENSQRIRAMALIFGIY